MNLNLLGRVSNTHLPLSKVLLPLFEAVINSIQAIEEMGNIDNGIIEIEVIRDNSQTKLDFKDNISLNPVTGFIIKDNGIGFNQDNYNSFQTSDSRYKKDRGGKGIGRFLWLKAFTKVKIESVFDDNGRFYKRSFDFSLNNADGITNEVYENIEAKSSYTEIQLVDYLKEYKDKCPKKLKTIAFRIIEHCLSYFALNKCPTIKIKDCNEILNLNKIFKNEIKEYSNSDIFHIKKYKFNLTHMRLYSGEANKHMLYYCANDRVVFDTNLELDLPNLNKKIEDEDGNNFLYLAFLSSKYLDDNVNAERTSFNILQDIGMKFEDTLSMKEIHKYTLDYIRDYLHDYLVPIKEAKIKRISDYIHEKSPQYRPIMKYKEDELDKISPDLNDEKLEIELYKISQDIDFEIKRKSKEFLNKDIKDINKYKDYKKEYLKFIEQVNDVGKSNLAKYIIHRKIILDLFTNNLELQQEDSKYKLEEEIHEIIFPMRTTSDEIDYEKQNLWIIDEKLSYHNFLASDIPLNNISIIDTDDRRRPDVLVFNKALAFVEDDQPYSSIVIIEFKRPGRKKYDDKENPISQVYNYIREIKKGNKVDKKGRQIAVNDNTPCYAYIICDITDNIRTISENASLMKTPDNMGYFGYNKNLEAYIELISFDKLVVDARKRNKVLFNKLFSSNILYKSYYEQEL